MVQNNYETAADRILKIADEFSDCDEACQLLKEGSARIAKMAINNVIIKLAIETDDNAKSA